MAVDKFSGTFSPDFLATFNSRISLEDTLARFDEQVARLSPDVLRHRLKSGLGDMQVNINGTSDEDDN